MTNFYSDNEKLKFENKSRNNTFHFYDFIQLPVDLMGLLYMGSLDVDSLFTSIPFEETINISTESIHDQNDSIEGLNKSEFKGLLSLATKESYFIFNEILFKQIDGVAMGSPLGPTLPNELMRL